MARLTAPVRDVRVAAYTVPTDGPEGDGTLAWDATTVVVVQVAAGDATGVGWTYTDRAAGDLVHRVLAPEVIGRDALNPVAVHDATLRLLRNVGVPGLGAAAVSAIDIAMWDLAGRLLEMPVCSLLGSVREQLRIYGSGGFTTYDSHRTAEQVLGWVDGLGARAVKIKIGESWGTAVQRDLGRVAEVRELVGAGVDLMVDANGGYSVGQAVRVERAMREHGVVWFEEPVSSRDLPGLAHVRRHAEADIAAGEYGSTPADFRDLLIAGAVDTLQADVTRCGGFTGWRRVAALAQTFERPISTHCAPALSVHVAGCAPTLAHLEWFHDHTRLEAMLFDGVPVVTDGVVAPNADTGHGMRLRPDAEQWRVV
ncbi:enolase C-terminal domain-like protein [Cellulomonas sp. P24]|uniref:enolase C-terminal domain-like protein n=1 Tax=Cellulomonas sp. P24 TaxID=2885206 RepID=UPI00216ADB91|nr:enolase C-terminal domain-like protein [Cellulomonas sp. P24]MCR6491048.1 hypothetical protein [Cellulomonas sp. P24]